MFRNVFAVLIIMAVLLCLSGCGKKEETEPVGESTDTSTPAVVPGEMVLIPAGEFTLGTDDSKDIAYPQQKINLPAFWIDKYEVTNLEFLDFSLKTSYVGEGAKEGKDWRLFFTPATPEKAKLPVVYITWNDAAAYCKSLGKRLPTEEEWEKAARGTDGNRYPWGNEWVNNKGNTSESGLGKAAPIGEFDDVSPFGVHDMLGNVQEWTASWYVTYKGNPKKDPQSGHVYRVVRGLSNRYKGKVGSLWVRSAQPAQALYDFGCRCAKDATPEDVAKAAQAKK